MDPHHPDPHERGYLWAKVYDQKKYELQLARYQDEEAYMHQNGNFTPQLNDKSMAIADAMQMTPIHERTEEVLYKRNEYLTMRRKQVYDAEVCQECTFCPRLHPKSVGMQGRDARSLYRWDIRKAQKVNAKLQNQLQAEARTCPFTPELTGASRKIAEEYTNAKNVHDRLFEDHRRRHRENTEEQAVLKKLTPKSYADAGDENTKAVAEAKKKTIQSARERPVSVPPTWLMDAKRPASARAGRGDEAGGRSKKEPSRASMSVLPHRINRDPSSYDGGTRKKKGNPYAESASPKRDSGTTGKARKSRSFVLMTEKPPPPPPKTAITGGKNIVMHNAKFAELVESVRTYATEGMGDDGSSRISL